MEKKNIIISLCILFTIIFIIGISSTMITDAKESSRSPKPYNYYTSIYIEKGDTLWSIAEQYAYDGISTMDYINELKEINNLKDETIYAGCYLLISYYSHTYIE